ncbi:Histamine H1 receptor [Sarcoptes scabiei]|uniref:Histamine H1 receptor n=1 Tax=Sarcoptes scabiei TaxID=52283 RepID=A0A834VFF8_SARSC|nr:Histamine H1 receptor [Sarcoptes scabiei]
MIKNLDCKSIQFVRKSSKTDPSRAVKFRYSSTFWIFTFASITETTIKIVILLINYSLIFQPTIIYGHHRSLSIYRIHKDSLFEHDEAQNEYNFNAYQTPDKMIGDSFVDNNEDDDNNDDDDDDGGGGGDNDDDDDQSESETQFNHPKNHPDNSDLDPRLHRGSVDGERKNDSAPTTATDPIHLSFTTIGLNENSILLIFLGIILALLSLLTFLGNAMVVHAIRTERKLHTVSNMFILSLAIADLIVGLVVMPLSSTYVLYGDWILGLFVCQFWLLIDYTASTASILNLLILSLDRYWSIRSPLKYLSERTKKRALAMIGIVWLISALWSIPIIGWHRWYNNGVRKHPGNVCETEFSDSVAFKLTTSIANFIIPMSLMVILYYKIFREIKRRKNFGDLNYAVSRVFCQKHQHHHHHHQQQQQQHQQTRCLKNRKERGKFLQSKELFDYTRNRNRPKLDWQRLRRETFGHKQNESKDNIVEEQRNQILPHSDLIKDETQSVSFSSLELERLSSKPKSLSSTSTMLLVKNSAPQSPLTANEINYSSQNYKTDSDNQNEINTDRNKFDEIIQKNWKRIPKSFSNDYQQNNLDLDCDYCAKSLVLLHSKKPKAFSIDDGLIENSDQKQQQQHHQHQHQQHRSRKTLMKKRTMKQFAEQNESFSSPNLARKSINRKNLIDRCLEHNESVIKSESDSIASLKTATTTTTKMTTKKRRKKTNINESRTNPDSIEGSNLTHSHPHHHHHHYCDHQSNEDQRDNNNVWDEIQHSQQKKKQQQRQKSKRLLNRIVCSESSFSSMPMGVDCSRILMHQPTSTTATVTDTTLLTPTILHGLKLEQLSRDNLHRIQRKTNLNELRLLSISSAPSTSSSMQSISRLPTRKQTSSAMLLMSSEPKTTVVKSDDDVLQSTQSSQPSSSLLISQNDQCDTRVGFETFPSQIATDVSDCCDNLMGKNCENSFKLSPMSVQEFRTNFINNLSHKSSPITPSLNTITTTTSTTTVSENFRTKIEKNPNDENKFKDIHNRFEYCFCDDFDVVVGDGDGKDDHNRSKSEKDLDFGKNLSANKSHERNDDRSEIAYFDRLTLMTVQQSKNSDIDPNEILYDVEKKKEKKQNLETNGSHRKEQQKNSDSVAIVSDPNKYETIETFDSETKSLEPIQFSMNNHFASIKVKVEYVYDLEHRIDHSNRFITKIKRNLNHQQLDDHHRDPIDNHHHHPHHQQKYYHHSKSFNNEYRWDLINRDCDYKRRSDRKLIPPIPSSSSSSSSLLLSASILNDQIASECFGIVPKRSGSDQSLMNKFDRFARQNDLNDGRFASIKNDPCEPSVLEQNSCSKTNRKENHRLCEDFQLKNANFFKQKLSFNQKNDDDDASKSIVKGHQNRNESNDRKRSTIELLTAPSSSPISSSAAVVNQFFGKNDEKDQMDKLKRSTNDCIIDLASENNHQNKEENNDESLIFLKQSIVDIDHRTISDRTEHLVESLASKSNPTNDDQLSDVLNLVDLVAEQFDDVKMKRRKVPKNKKQQPIQRSRSLSSSLSRMIRKTNMEQNGSIRKKSIGNVKDKSYRSLKCCFEEETILNHHHQHHQPRRLRQLNSLESSHHMDPHLHLDNQLQSGHYGPNRDNVVDVEITQNNLRISSSDGQLVLRRERSRRMNQPCECCQQSSCPLFDLENKSSYEHKQCTVSKRNHQNCSASKFSIKKKQMTEFSAKIPSQSIQINVDDERDNNQEQIDLKIKSAAQSNGDLQAKEIETIETDLLRTKSFDTKDADENEDSLKIDNDQHRHHRQHSVCYDDGDDSKSKQNKFTQILQAFNHPDNVGERKKRKQSIVEKIAGKKNSKQKFIQCNNCVGGGFDQNQNQSNKSINIGKRSLRSNQTNRSLYNSLRVKVFNLPMNRSDSMRIASNEIGTIGPNGTKNLIEDKSYDSCQQCISMARAAAIHRNDLKREENSRLRQEKKAARQLGVILGAFILCWMPYVVVYVVTAYCTYCISLTGHQITIWLGYFNSFLNPFLYALCNENFKYAFKKMLGRLQQPQHLSYNFDPTFIAPGNFNINANNNNTTTNTNTNTNNNNISSNNNNLSNNKL